MPDSLNEWYALELADALRNVLTTPLMDRKHRDAVICARAVLEMFEAERTKPQRLAA